MALYILRISSRGVTALYSVLLMACLLAAPVFSQDIDTEKQVDLEPITVTGTGKDKKISDTPIQTVIVDAESIDESGAETLADVLENAGIQFAETGMGSHIQLQGMSGERVLILIDGKRLTGRVAGNFELRTIPADNIERIEIVRGPQSALYGSDAIGGVINIITKKPADEIAFSYTVQNNSMPISEGSDSALNSILLEQTGSGTLDIPIGKASNSITMTAGHAFPYLDSQDIAIYPEYEMGKIDVCTEYAPDFSTNLSCNLGGSFYREDDQTTGSGSFDRIDTTRGNASLTYAKTLNTSTDLSITGYYNYFGREKTQYSSLLDRWYESGGETEHYVAAEAFYTRYFTNRNQLDAVLSYSYDQLEKYNIQNSAPQRRNTLAFVLQDEQYATGTYSIIGGLRSEYSDDYGWFFSPKLSGMYYIGENLRILPAVGIGYRAPTFLELYLDTAGEIYHKYGNPDLNPEKSLGCNLGIELLSERLTIQVNGYHSELVDEIVYDYTDEYEESGLQIIRKENLSRSFRSGVDLTSDMEILPFLSAWIHYGFQYGYNRTEQSVINDNPAHTLNTKVKVVADRYGVGGHVSLDISGPHSHRDATKVIVNLYVKKDLGKNNSIYAGIDNLTGETDEFSTYEAGPVVYLGLNGRF